MANFPTVCDACGGYGLAYERGLGHELREAKAEVKRLRAELEAAYDNLANADARIERLEAEVERLN